MNRTRLLFSILILFLLVYACDTKKRSTKTQFISPEAGSVIRSGNPLLLKLQVPDSQMPVDSIVYSIEGATVSAMHTTDSVILDTDNFAFGNKTLSARVYKDGKETVAHSNIVIVPQPPQYYSYRVINEYPHDPTAFTQGLEYHDGFLYESTGQYEGKSTLRRTSLETGEVLKKIHLGKQYFGEGLTIVGDRLIQLTWMEKTGFVYNLETFEKIAEFPYGQNKEGWGICFDGERLIVSDGTSRLYFLNPETYEEEYTVEVYNHQGPQKSLNELEYINGKVYANVYQEDIIVIINPVTGAIEGEINLLGIYPGKDDIPYDNELNGIAYDRNNDRLFVTGKNWSKLFEIELVAR